MRPVLYLAWNAQGMLERVLRGAGALLVAAAWPVLQTLPRGAGLRILHALLRGMSRDRLEVLGAEYCHGYLLPKAPENARLSGPGLEQVVRPLAESLSLETFPAIRLEFRDGIATGRIESRSQVSRTRRGFPRRGPDLLPGLPPETLSVRSALAGRHVLLLGGSGFIGKVWLHHALRDLPELGRLTLLLRPRSNASAAQRFDRLLAQSPVFGALSESERAGVFQRVEVVEGDVSQPRLGLEAETFRELQDSVDLVLNCSGVTDFSPDLRTALATNVDGALFLAEFLRGCRKAGLLHLSTCYVAGSREGRIGEVPVPRSAPAGVSLDPEAERSALWALAARVERRLEGPAVTEELRREVLARVPLKGEALEGQIRKLRTRRLRLELTEAGRIRAEELGWQNTYTFTKSLGELLLQRRGAGLPIAVVRPSIVETSLRDPFRGWNEGINTSAPISYALGTFFRQLPSRPHHRLDLIPVDLVCRGITLVAAALAARRHEPVYQLASSHCNPCDMRRAIELTGLTHRRDAAEPGLRAWLRARCDTIPVSQRRYRILSAPGQRIVVRALRALFPQALLRADRGLFRLEKMVELYKPFIHDYDHVFVSERIVLLTAALPQAERSCFGYDPGEVDWREYWMDVHIPALRRWSYPLLEGRTPPDRTPKSFRVPVPLATGT